MAANDALAVPGWSAPRLRPDRDGAAFRLRYTPCTNSSQAITALNSLIFFPLRTLPVELLGSGVVHLIGMPGYRQTREP
jgi:hypothetical protein